MLKNKKKRKILKDKILSILVVLLMVVTVVLIVTSIINRNNLNTSSDIVTELHNYFSTDDLSNCEGLFTYASDKVEYSDVASETKLCLAYQKADIKPIETKTKKADKNEDICTIDGMIFRTDDETNECTYSKIDRKVVDSSYKKLYGKEVEDNDSFKIDNLNICYLKEDYYYCGLSETFTYTIGSESIIYRVINKAVEKGNNIIIYDYFIKIKDEECYKNYTTTAINEKCSDKYSNDNEVSYRFMKKYGTEYKHVFQKDKNDNYHWVSSEPIK